MGCSSSRSAILASNDLNIKASCRKSLCEACLVGDLEQVRKLLKSFDLVDINYFEPQSKSETPGYTPLMLAAQIGSKEVVQELLNHSPAPDLQISRKDEYGDLQTAMMIAITANQSRVVTLFVRYCEKKAPAGPCVCCRQDYNYLKAAQQRGAWSIFQILLDHCPFRHVCDMLPLLRKENRVYCNLRDRLRRSARIGVKESHFGSRLPKVLRDIIVDKLYCDYMLPRNLRVLIVDDCKISRTTLSIKLSQMTPFSSLNWSVDVTGFGDKALQEHFELIKSEDKSFSKTEKCQTLFNLDTLEHRRPHVHPEIKEAESEPESKAATAGEFKECKESCRDKKNGDGELKYQRGKHRGYDLVFVAPLFSQAKKSYITGFDVAEQIRCAEREKKMKALSTLFDEFKIEEKSLRCCLSTGRTAENIDRLSDGELKEFIPNSVQREEIIQFVNTKEFHHKLSEESSDCLIFATTEACTQTDTDEWLSRGADVVWGIPIPPCAKLEADILDCLLKRRHLPAYLRPRQIFDSSEASHQKD